MTRTFWLTLSALLLAAALSAQPKASPTPAAKSAVAPNAQQDKRIEAELRTRLSKSVIGKDGFTVRVEAGVIYLEGVTGVPQHKGAATRMANSVMKKTPGVRRVVNNIRVAKAGSRPVAHVTISKPLGQLATSSPVAPKSQAVAGVPTVLPTPASAVAEPTGGTGPRHVTVAWK